MEISCIIANYNWKTFKIYVFKNVILEKHPKSMCLRMLFWYVFWSCQHKEVRPHEKIKNIIPIIDRGMFLNYVCLCVQAVIFIWHNQKP